jgi:hypothetical protein
MSKADVPVGATNAAAEPSASHPAARPRRSGAVQGTNAPESPESPAAEQRADERAEGRATVRGKARVPIKSEPERRAGARAREADARAAQARRRAGGDGRDVSDARERHRREDAR